MSQRCNYEDESGKCSFIEENSYMSGSKNIAIDPTGFCLCSYDETSYEECDGYEED